MSTNLGAIPFQDNDVSPDDPNNSTIGSEVGFKIQGEFTANASKIFANFIGNYSTANDTYYTRARLGLNIASGIPLGPLSLSASAGYSEVDGIGNREGAYGGAVASFQF